MKEIAYRDWDRHEHAEFMGRMQTPFFQAQCTLDVTHFRQYVKARGISFYFGLIWAATKVMEAREDFRWRLRGDRVVLVDSPEPSFTDMMAGTDLFKIVHAGIAGDDMAAYAKRARATADAQTVYFPSEEEEIRDDFTYFSSTPLATFTGIMQAMNTDRDNFIPAVAWSKYWEADGRILMPLAIGCNHRQVDGLHVSRFFNEMQVFIDALD